VPLERAVLTSGALSAPSSDGVAPLVIAAEPGRVLGLIGAPGFGLTRLGLSLLAGPARTGMVAVVDVRGWLCPVAAWEAGIPPDRLVVVRCADRRSWSMVTASLVEGFSAVYAEVPARLTDSDLRRLAALARARHSALILRPVSGDLPGGILHLRIEADEVRWEGVDRGHGALLRRRLTLRASGKGARGMEQVVEVDDGGVHLVSANPARVEQATG
jgi:hypothetical protein